MPKPKVIAVAAALLFLAATSGTVAVPAAASTAPPAPAVPRPPAEMRRLGAPTISAAEILEKNAAARGGLEAWRKIQSMAWVGHVEGGAPAPMPFFLQAMRPNKTRFEIAATDRRFLRVFDGTSGWRVRPGEGGAPEASPFSGAENDFARGEFVIEGPLLDHEAKGVKVRVAGLDEIEGRKAHLLEVTLPTGASRRIWIDAETFLEIRSDRPSTSPLVQGAPVSVYYRDYRPVDGLLIPLTIETRPENGGRGSERIVIEKVALNPELPEQAFARPPTAWRRKANVHVGGDPSMPAPPGGPGP